ncbi:MAG TPA: diguanylate cyclase [Candidatus Binatia bacterium]|nr:diguanylate cyclase [Candidatus Binatia bacterium]
MKDLVDHETWQLVQDRFSALIGLPVVTVDMRGQVVFKSGAFPFFCELVMKKGGQFCTLCRQDWADKAAGVYQDSCHAGLYAMSAPIIIDERKVGAIIVESVKADQRMQEAAVKASSLIGLGSDELVDEIPQIPQQGAAELATMRHLLELFAATLPRIASERLKDKRELQQLNVLFDFLNELSATFDVNKILNTTLNFSMKTFGLQDCSIRYGADETRFSYLENRNEACKALENALWAHISNSKTPLFLEDVRNDFLMGQLPGVSSVANSVFALPILWNGVAKGMLVLYGKLDEDLRQYEDVVRALTQRVEAALAAARKYKDAQETAITDKLTNLYNKHYFVETFKNEVARAAKFKRPTSLIIFDIDNFKSYNDTYGHPEGDKLLAQMGKVLREAAGTIDTCCRYGGEEFVVILPETKPEHALAVGEKIRAAVDGANFPNRKTTISVGSVTCMNSSASPDFMLKEADRALYKSKHLGKNRVTGFIIVDKNLGTIDASEASGQKIV